MIRMSEMVLPGHPDKFCDQVADAVIAEAMQIDADAYAQVEVATGSDQVWINGGICTRRPMERPLADIVREVGRGIGYTDGNAIDAGRYQVQDAVCKQVGDPARWSAHVNDQCIIVGCQAMTRGPATCRRSTSWRTCFARRSRPPAGRCVWAATGRWRVRGRTASS